MKNSTFAFMFLMGTQVLLIGCADQSLENYKARAEAEQDGSNRSENENLSLRAAQLEKDLWSQFAFYKAIESQFRGSYQRNANKFKVEIFFAPSRYLIKTERSRTLAEVEEDLANLHLKALLKVSAVDVDGIARGCVFENIRPDLENGVIHLIDEKCPLIARVRFSDSRLKSLNPSEASRLVASEVRQGLRTEVQELQVSISSKLTDVSTSLILERTPTK